MLKNLEVWTGVGPLESSRILMGWAFGKTLEKNGRISFLELVSILEMVDTRDFGETFGLGVLS